MRSSVRKVQEPVETLEVSGQADAYHLFGPGLRGVAGECLLVCFGVGAKFHVAVSMNLMVVPVMSVCGDMMQEILMWKGSAFSQNTAFSAILEIIMFGNFLKGK